jgi:hypothetical protein
MAMPTLVLSTQSIPADRALATAARALGWDVHALDVAPLADLRPPVVVYVDTDAALHAARTLNLALLEPPLDLLARLPNTYRLRNVEAARFRDLARLTARAFIKPADPLGKVFDAGVYASAQDIRQLRPIDPEMPVLVAEPVEWVTEYRCFVREKKLTAFSPYIHFGRPSWKPWGHGGELAQLPGGVADVCQRLFADKAVTLPPAFVVDVGLIDERGWAVVEFNPVWSAGLLGADPAAVLPVLARACRHADELDATEERWLVARS